MPTADAFDRQFPSQLRAFTCDQDDPEDVPIDEALSIRYFADLAEAQLEKGNVPVDHFDSAGRNITPAVDHSVYVGVEQKSSTRSPDGLIWYSMFVIPETDWPRLAPIYAAIADPSTLDTVSGTVSASDIDLPISRMVTDEYGTGKVIDWMPDWFVDPCRLEELLDSGVMTARGAATESSTVLRAITFDIISGGIDTGDIVAGSSAVLERANGISLAGQSSTISLAHTADSFIEIVQTGSQRVDLTRLTQLSAQRYSEILTRPRR